MYEPDAGWCVRGAPARRWPRRSSGWAAGSSSAGSSFPSARRLGASAGDAGHRADAARRVVRVRTRAVAGQDVPEIFAEKMRTPLGYVCYFGTPVNEQRFTYPNIPSYNFRV